MVMPQSAVKAVKEARKYLLPYSTRELASLLFSEIRSKMSNYRGGLHAQATEVTKHLGLGWSVKEDAIEELKHMKDSGYVFKTTWLSRSMVNIDSCYAAYQEYKAYKPNAKFVRIEGEGDDLLVHVLTVEDVLAGSEIGRAHV